MKKLKLFAFSLIAFLCFGVISVNAETVTVGDLDQYMLYLTSTDTRHEIVKLGADIDISSLSEAGNDDAIFVNDSFTLDLNGFTITTKSAHVKLWYYGDYTVTITDSSLSNTGKIFSDNSKEYPIIESVNVNGDDSKLVLENITVESNDSLHNYMIYYREPERGTYDLEIDGTTFIKGNKVFEHKNSDNPQVDVNIKSMTTTSMRRINQYGDYKVSDIIDTDTTELVVNGNVIDPNTTISGYDVSTGAVVRAKDGFEVSNVAFDTKQYGYSSVSAKPISIKTVGSTAKQVKTVTVNEPSKFTVAGSGTPTIAVGSTDNTTFTIKPVDGLAIGTHTAIITVTDMDDKTFTATVTFEVTKADIIPSVSIADWSYGSTASTPSVTGNPGNGTVTYEYKVKDSADNTYSNTVPTEVGEYTIRATVEATTNYNEGVATANFKITDDKFEVTAVTFDTVQYNYSSISAKPIAIKTVGSTSRQVKTVTVDDTSKFTVAGSGTPTIAVGSTDNTTFTIKPVDGLAVGTHTAIITVTDMDDKTFTATVTFEVTTADITPVVSISNWSYGSTASTPSVTGNPGNGTITYEYKVKDSADSTYSATVPTEVGQYTIRAIVEETTNFKSGKNEKDFFINKGTYGEAIAYTKEVLEKKIAKYCILVSDLNLPVGFVNAYMVTFNDSGSYANGVISEIGFENSHAQLCIETGSIDANNSSTFKLTISSKNYEDKEATITVKTIAKEPITIDGLTYTSRDYNNTPIIPTGTLTHTGYTGTIDVLYEGTDGTIYNSTTAPTNVGKYKVTYSIPSDNESYTGSKVYTFEIKKATPIYTIPTGLTGIVGNELSDVTLPSGFTWEEEDTVLVEGNQTYKGIYTPTDTNNYKTITNLNIPVYVKDKYTISTDVNGGNGTISSSATVVEGTEYVITFTPAVGYMIDTVKVNDGLVTVTANTYTLSNITENKNIVVTYKKIPFTITVNEVTGATITPNGTINVLYGDNKEITITADLGYRLKSVKVNNEEKLPLTENKIILTNITEDQEVVVVVERIEYEVTTGDGQKHIIGKNDDAVFRIDADKDLFLKVYLNDEELDSAFYTITEGSTIITLKQDFLNNLLPNTYNLKATFSDGGEATATFVIAQPAEDNPKTGDPIMLSIILGSVSLIGLLGAGLYLKKKNA